MKRDYRFDTWYVFLAVSVLRDLDATHDYELVSAMNIPPGARSSSCGLRPEPALVYGLATPNDSARFTR